MNCAKYLYVLKLEDNCYYVGITRQLNNRLSQHYNEDGSKWTKLHKPIETIHKEKLPSLYKPYVYENMWTLKCMKQYNVENVRGGAWSQVSLYEPSRIKIQRMIDEDRCFKCKKKGHHMDHCEYEYTKDIHD